MSATKGDERRTALLAALETTCRSLGVDFERRLVETRRDLNPASTVVLCAGASTLPLLRRLELQATTEEARARLAKPRSSVGTVFAVNETKHLRVPHVPGCPRPVLWDLPRKDGVQATLSGAALSEVGPEGSLFVSSTTVRIGAPAEGTLTASEQAAWVSADDALWQAALKFVPGISRDDVESRQGLRVGFGHAELVACALEGMPQTWDGVRCYLIAGAHKSGFLFAPGMQEVLRGLGAL